MITSPLRHFQASEFRHPELVDDACAQFLDEVRDRSGVAMMLTSDARTPAENAAASGSSPTSLHLLGRAFDFEMPASAEDLWRLIEAVVAVKRERGLAVEWELVRGPTDHHCHLGFFTDASHPSKLELNLT